MAASSVEFSFDEIMHHKIDVVVMGSSLGLALANTFCWLPWIQPFQITFQPEMYYCYMDDTFLVFSYEGECDRFVHICLNSLHPSLRFTFDKDLPFLDVLVEKSLFKFITSIYRKPTFTGQYLRWNSFSPQKRKTNLLLTWTNRALVICSPER